MVDACTTHIIDTKQQTLDYLWKNFNRYYGNNKAPFGVKYALLHGLMMNTTSMLWDEFISELSRMNDVYVVSLPSGGSVG